MAKNSSGKTGKRTRDAQVVCGIEQAALALLYSIDRPDPASAESLVAFIQQLMFTDPTDEDPAPQQMEERTLRYDRGHVREKYSVQLDLKQRSLEGFDEPTGVRVCRDYAWYVFANYSDDALNLALRNIAGEGSEKPRRLLSYLFLLRYACKFQLTIDLQYQKLFATKTEPRRVKALDIRCRDRYIDLIAQDTGDGKTKQFILSCIKSIDTDLREAFNRRAPLSDSGFDHRSYSQEAEYNWGQDTFDAEFRMAPLSLQHFQLTFPHELEVTGVGSDGSVVRVRNIREREALAIAFDYGRYCTLMGPEPLVQAYRNRVEEIQGAHAWG